MRKFLPITALAWGLAVSTTLVAAKPVHAPVAGPDLAPEQAGSPRPSDYSNGYGTNAANSYPVGRPVDAYGGYVVNQYGFGNYVSGPAGFGGYPAGSADAQIWRQREQWKCNNAPETC